MKIVRTCSETVVSCSNKKEETGKKVVFVGLDVDNCFAVFNNDEVHLTDTHLNERQTAVDISLFG